eukprot:3031206-Alexandrium_andersonii.AAC.1
MGLLGSLGPWASAGWPGQPTGLRTGGGRHARRAAARSAARRALCRTAPAAVPRCLASAQLSRD